MSCQEFLSQYKSYQKNKTCAGKPYLQASFWCPAPSVGRCLRAATPSSRVSWSDELPWSSISTAMFSANPACIGKGKRAPGSLEAGLSVHGQFAVVACPVRILVGRSSVFQKGTHQVHEKVSGSRLGQKLSPNTTKKPWQQRTGCTGQKMPAGNGCSPTESPGIAVAAEILAVKVKV